MQVPGPVRAVVGLLATAADEAKHLPDRAIELPMLAVSTALQMSLRAQQRYARLTARGDDVLHRRPTTDEPPAWATFDDPVSVGELRAVGLDDPDPAERARAATQLLDELLGKHNGAKPAVEPPAKRAPAAKKTAAPQKAAAKKSTAKKASARKSSGTRTGKAINPPRHTSPSRFDTVDE